MKKVLSCCLALLMLCCVTMPAFAAENKSVALDIMIVVDDTVSMQENDQNHYATVALQQFADKLPSQGSRVGLATYANSILKSLDFVDVSVDTSQRLKDFANSNITQQGHYTDLPLALSYATGQLDALSDKGNPQAIIAVSDGENDYYSQADADLSEECLAVATQAGVPVYIIAINLNASDVATYLDGITAQTGGATYFVNSGDEVAAALDDIQNQLYGYVKSEENEDFDKEVGEEPLDWAFSLPEGVFEANLELTHEKSLELALSGTDGNEIAMEESNGIIVASTPSAAGYKTVVKMLEPDAGQYTLKIASSGGEVQHVLGTIILNNEIYVEITPSSDKVECGKEYSVRAKLKRGDADYQDLAFDTLHAVLTVTNQKDASDIQTLDMTANNSGFSCNVMAGKQDATYDLVVEISGKTFNRTSNVCTVEAQNPAVGSASSATSGNAVQQDKESSLPTILIVVLVLVLVAAVVVFLLMRKKGNGTVKDVAVSGSLAITCRKDGICVADEALCNLGYRFRKAGQKVPLMRLLKDYSETTEYPEIAQNITVTGYRSAEGRQVVDIFVSNVNPEEPNSQYIRLEISTGMQMEDDVFGGGFGAATEASATLQLEDGHSFEFMMY